MPRSLRESSDTNQSPETYFRNVFIVVDAPLERTPRKAGPRAGGACQSSASPQAAEPARHARILDAGVRVAVIIPAWSMVCGRPERRRIR
jgi:hypothetical protein